MNKKTIQLSVNPHIENKFVTDKRYLSEDFRSMEVTLEEISDLVNHGFAFSYQFAGGVRKSTNFLATDFLAVDVDSGMTIGEAYENPVVQKYCSMMYKTPSHSPDHHRFRLFFVLPRTITKVAELKAAASSLTQRLSGDPKTTDAARMFYGSTGSEPVIFDGEITKEFLDELIKDGKIQPARESVGTGCFTTNRSELEIDPELSVKTAYGQWKTVGEIDKKVSIHCPFHDDRSPSAFAAISNKGNKFIRCTVCQKTWFVRDGKSYEETFNGFDRLLRKIKNGETEEALSRDNMTSFLTPRELPPGRIVVTNDEHLKIGTLQNGLTLIRSPKGTGKTTYMAHAIGDAIYRYKAIDEFEKEGDFEHDPLFYSDTRILLIGHRRALIGDLCKRLSLNCYLDDPQGERQVPHVRRNRYGVCLDSLHRVQGEKYDIIVIDESEQVLSHYLSDTIGERRRGLFRIFCQLLRKAKKIVALDADLGWVTYVTLSYLTRVDKGSRDRPSPMKCQIYLNDWKPSNREICLYESMEQLINEIKKSVLRDRRVFVTSNSKEKVKNLTKSLEELGKKLGKEISIKNIHSENSQTQEQQEFIKNIKTEILKYQVVLASPSLGTGIDISFENGSSEIDDVFGLFENQINTHFEIDQQLARVRNPKTVHVWISSRQFRFETDFQVAGEDFLQQHMLDMVGDEELSSDWDIETCDVDPFLRMAAMIVSQQRASKNSLKENFIRYRQEQGWSFNVVKDDETEAEEGKALYKSGKEVSEREWMDQMLSASVMNRVDYWNFKEELKGVNPEYSREELFEFRRTGIELFYRRVLDEQLLKEDKKGERRRQLVLFEGLEKRLRRDVSAGMENDRDNEKGRKNINLEIELFRNKGTAIVLIQALLSVTPVLVDGKFDTETAFEKGALGTFVRASKRLSRLVQSQLGIATQSDIDENPVQHLGKILKKIGLGWQRTVKSGKNGKTYFYRLDPETLERNREVCAARERSGNDGWDFVNEHYQLKYTDRELEWLDAMGAYMSCGYEISKPKPLKKIRVREGDGKGRRGG